MAVPKRKVTPSRKHIRNVTSKKNIQNALCNYAICKQCNYIKKKHSICTNCRYYNEGVIPV